MGSNPWTYLLIFIAVIAGFTVVLGLLFSLLMGALGGRIADRNTEKYRKRMEALLPGKNCGACGFESCAAYADAVLHAMADEDLCPHIDQGEAARLDGIRAQLQASLEDPTPLKDRKQEKWSTWNKDI